MKDRITAIVIGNEYFAGKVKRRHDDDRDRQREEAVQAGRVRRRNGSRHASGSVRLAHRVGPAELTAIGKFQPTRLSQNGSCHPNPVPSFSAAAPLMLFCMEALRRTAGHAQ